jgi:hypothetical protein
MHAGLHRMLCTVSVPHSNVSYHISVQSLLELLFRALQLDIEN